MKHLAYHAAVHAIVQLAGLWSAAFGAEIKMPPRSCDTHTAVVISKVNDRSYECRVFGDLDVIVMGPKKIPVGSKVKITHHGGRWMVIGKG